MSADTDSPRYGAESSGPGESGAAADDEVLAWVSGPVEPEPVVRGGGCPTCGFAGDLAGGPHVMICPACLAEYPKLVPGHGPVVMTVRCEGCDLVIGITEVDREKTLVCPRCKYFLGCVLHKVPRRPWSR